MKRRLSGKSFGRLADLVTGVMMLALSGLGILQAGNIPNLDPITIWPFWIWSVCFTLLALALSRLLRARRTTLVVGFALITGLILSEEPWFLLRGLWYDGASEVRDAAARGDLMRVVTLNCGGGDAEAVEDAYALDPDIILLQESPGAALLQRTMPDGWEHAGWGDCAVLVRGRAYASEHSRPLAHAMYVVRATPERLGRPLTVISTHLVQPMLRTDIWRSEMWDRAGRLSRARVDTVNRLLQQRDRYGDDIPAIIGGDFNTPAGDWLLEPLAANGLTDTFAAAGHGWPNTITSDYPMERIDFIWADEHFEPLAAHVVVTPHSDHRMAVAELASR